MTTAARFAKSESRWNYDYTFFAYAHPRNTFLPPLNDLPLKFDEKYSVNGKTGK
jgi:hypothetical protein